LLLISQRISRQEGLPFGDDEKGADMVDDLIKRGNEEEIIVCMNSINVAGRDG
jgi:hypothetical protein